jgi:hypothetical protein
MSDKNTVKTRDHEKNKIVKSIAKSLTISIDMNVDAGKYVAKTGSVLGQLSPPNTPGPNRPKKPGWGE